MKTNRIADDAFSKIVRDKKVRRAITKQSFWYFFHIYFSHYVQYKTAEFQQEIMRELESSSTNNLYIVAFRNSGKSTIVTTAYPLWAILGEQQKKYVLIFSKTQGQAKQILKNIREEAESNDILKQDLGPFKEESEYGSNGEWSSTTLVFSNTGARIKIASVDEGIRGLRHKQYRPDLIICDDVEDINSTKTREGRDKTYKWLRGDVIPAGDRDTRLIAVGNLLHEDSLLMRLKEDTENDRATGAFLIYPLLDENGVSLWPDKYPDSESIKVQEKEIGSWIDWQREFLLNIVPDTDQVIHKNWIQYYGNLPERGHTFAGVRVGIDLAISTKDTADKTAMVSGVCHYYERELFIYILPNPVNKRLTAPDTLSQCQLLYEHYRKEKMYPKLIVEDVGYQKAIIQHLEEKKILAQSFKPGRSDKRERLALTSSKIKSGHILFPYEGCEQLIQQLTHFGVEKHDDLADAFSTLILGVQENKPSRPGSIEDLIVGGERSRFFDFDDEDFGFGGLMNMQF